MDVQQQEFWNTKFEKDGFMYGEKPNMFIKYNLNGVKKNGKVLCLAEGEGRNAIFLAQEGFHVETIDNSDVGVNKLNAKAKELNLDITAHHMDLNDWNPQTQTYDAIVASFMHLPEPLRTQTFKHCIDALNINGRIIMEFFSKDQMRENYSSGGPKDLDLLYEVETLSPIFNADNLQMIQLSQEVDTLDEGWGHQGLASLVRLIIKKVS